MLVFAVVILSGLSTALVVRLRQAELRHGSSKGFVVAIALVNAAAFSMIALLVW